MNNPLRILLIGCGNQGGAHARAITSLEAFELCGLVSTGESKHRLNATLPQPVPCFDDMQEAIRAQRPDAVCIATWPDSHESLAITALAAGCHVFIEKPLATTIIGAKRVISTANLAGKKLVVGYILRHHPMWQCFIEKAQSLGKPLAMRMNLNQQSEGGSWQTHRQLMRSLSPIVDCGVHYLDVMCQMTQAEPVSVSAIGVRLSDEIPPEQYNYGQLQVRFSDGSVGWYEAGWGPMMSQTAFFIKDVIGPRGSVSIVAREAGGEGQSANVAAHTRTESLRIHRSELDAKGGFMHQDEWIVAEDEPDHDALCRNQLQFFARSIRQDSDLSLHLQQVVASLAVVLAADQAVREQRTIALNENHQT